MKKTSLLIALPLLALAAAIAMPLHAATSSLKILKFEADWCGACQKMKPVFSSVSKSSPAGVTFQSINVDSQTALAEQYKIETLKLLNQFYDNRFPLGPEVVGLVPLSMCEQLDPED